MKQTTIFAAIKRERIRQDVKHGKNTCANPELSNFIKSTILQEENGEVGKAVIELNYGKGTVADLRTELIQTAAVCVAWLESFPPSHN